LVSHRNNVREKTIEYTKGKKCEYQYINPLRCEPDIAKRKMEFVDLRNDLINYIEAQKKEGVLTSAAVYFRDLENGPMVSVDGEENFIPASLLKLPLMITYYKKAQADPSVLQRKITVPNDVETITQNIVPEKSARGQTYTVDELINIMITESDNVAWKALLTNLREHYSEEDFVDTLSDIGIVDPRKSDDQQLVSVPNYASIFRILYNASYLNIEMSNKALDVLSKSVFKDGIVGGVPEDLKVAHKFGELDNGSEKQFHDCGIVYNRQNPYLICIMTRGAKLPDLLDITKNLSKLIFKEVEARELN